MKNRLSTLTHWLNDPLRLQQQSLALQRDVKRWSSQCLSLFATLLFFSLALHAPDAHALLPANNTMVPASVDAQGSFMGKTAGLFTIGFQVFFSILGAGVLAIVVYALILSFSDAREKRAWGHFGAVFIVGSLVLAVAETGCITGFTYSANLVSLVV